MILDVVFGSVEALLGLWLLSRVAAEKFGKQVLWWGLVGFVTFILGIVQVVDARVEQLAVGVAS